MNTLLKVGATSVLALGALSAHATGGIVGGKSSSTPGDLLLFAEVVNSSNVATAFYVGDTNIQVTGTPASGLSTGTLIPSSDANLAALLAAASVAGATLEWAVQGGGYTPGVFDGGVLTTVSSSTALTQLQGRTNSNVGFMITGLTGIINNKINPAIPGTGTAKSYEGTTAVGWDATLPVASNGTNAEAWFNNGTTTARTGFGGATLYAVTAPYQSSVYGVAALGQISLTANGLSYSAVPLPPAVWLLGSGLLGLAGISRRKAAKA